MSKPKLNQGLAIDEELKVNPYLLRRMRAAMASFKPPRIRAKSTAAFLLLPQFRFCFEGMSHLYPVFIRMMATLFAEVSLIPPTHPALAVDAKDKKSYSFRKLFGEVWFRLKTNRATAYQWSMFGAVVIMITTFTAGLGAFVARFFLGVGEIAQAQIFEAFRHPGNPYNKGAGVTELNDTVGTITGASGLFDLRVQNNGISTDYALMVLDKVLRQGMANNPTGGALQNALGGLMQIYNSGMLVVACIMIGWMVISVIIDTAKTGTVGGGRHNMVWVPIRVLFALGIMFPLGSAGFSGGQYMVVKLAEWGSNFGTRGWATYVASVVGNQQLLSPYTVNNNTNMVTSISKIMVCQVAYNTYINQRTGSLDPDQIVEMKQDSKAGAPGTPQQSQLYITNRYTNNANVNMCGVIKYATDATPDDNSQFLKFETTTPNTAMTSSTPYVTGDNITKNVGMSDAVTGFRNAMRAALKNDLVDSADGTGAGSVITAAREFACKFVARRFSDGGGAGNPVEDIPMCAGKTAAGATTDPDASAQQTMLKTMQTAMMTAYTGTGKAALNGYVGTASTSPMMTEMSKRGWAGMAMWYQDIANLNNVQYTAQEPMAVVEPGAIWSGSGGAGWERCAGDNSESGEQCKMSGLEEKVFSIMNDYDRWWGVSALPGAAGKDPAAAPTQANEELNPSVSSSIGSILSWIGNVSIGDNGIVTVLMRFIFPRSTNVFLFKAVDLSATNTYPLAQLADTGHSVLGIGGLLWAGVTILQAVSTIDGAGFSMGKGLAFSALMSAIASIGSMMIMAGAVISFYLPALPFIRVAFAVLTWITSVFEAVIMVPVAALTHLSTQGPGLMGNHGRTAWTLWFNVFMRPILTVFGFIAGMLCYNSFAVFFHTTFEQGAAAVMSTQWYPMAVLAKVAYSVIYLGTLYAAANTSFKLLDVFPNHLMRWLGEWGAKQDTALLDGRSNIGGGLGFAGATIIKQLQSDIPNSRFIQPKILKDADMDRSNPNSVIARAAAMGVKDDMLTESGRARKANDMASARQRLTPAEKNQMNGLSSRDQDRFLQHKFLEQENKRLHRFGLERGHGYSLAESKKYGGTHMMKGKGGVNFDVSGGYNPLLWKFSMNKVSKGNELGDVGMMWQERIKGKGALWHGDNNQNFRALDGDPSLGRGQLAGASIGDASLDAALAGGSGAGMALMNEQQKIAVRQAIESQMSGADAVNYVSMSQSERDQFIQDYYDTEPELFAPGVGSDGTQAMFGYIKARDEMEVIGRLGLDGSAREAAEADHRRSIGYAEAMWEQRNPGSDDATQWGFMTRDEKATLANAYVKVRDDRMRAAENEMTAEQRMAFKNADGRKQAEFAEAKYAESVLRGLVARGVASEGKLTDLAKANEALANKIFKS